MEHTTSSTTGQDEVVKAIVEQSEATALQEAGKSKAKVADVANIQKEQVRGLFAKGGMVDQALVQDIESEIDQKNQERMASISATPDAHVFERTSSVAGFQEDGTKEVGLAHDVVQDPELAKRVSKHEGRHTEQEGGTEVAATIDEKGGTETIDRLALREADAIDAEGGINGHTPEYEGYVARRDAWQAELDEAGENGKALTEAAARTKEGFVTLHQKLTTARLKKRLENEFALAA